ncbi:MULTISPECIES: potassium channel family protein [Prosthecochloris]|uniref:Potassium channel protein n=1 Tax=Prosthecochloris marina TaxID=2017681 RepID=A0A317T4H6_9CHLB|nr:MULTISPECIES: potassium channel protein [Prosthecochloris]PWW81100.1 potassium channel protein [Prosthecochloris marina]UZJ37699.1 potassium channel protein [Prosthecochloris sp. SCSIO W1103]
MSRDTQQLTTFRRFSISIISLFFLIWIGVSGYIYIEDMTPVDALYMTVITLSTVGFSEVHTLSETGRLFTLALIIGGTSLFFFTLSSVAAFFLSGEWHSHWEQQRNHRMLLNLDNHYIICGYGRLGSNVASELYAKKIPFVVIDTLDEQVELARKLEYVAIKGNAADEKVLKNAGINKAKGLIASASTDAENVFIVLTARTLKPSLHIIARADCEESENKMLRAGAEHVVLLYQSAGRKMANMLIEPDLAQYLDELSDANQLDLQIAQFIITETSSLSGKTFREADLYNNYQINLVGYKLPEGEIHSTPKPSEVIQKKATIIAIGSPKALKNFKELAKGEQA